MSQTAYIVIILVLSLLSVSSANANNEVCTASAIQDVRNKSLTLYNTNDFSGSANTLEPIFSTCYQSLHEKSAEMKKLKNEYLWAFSDYSLSLHKSKNIKKCLSQGMSFLKSRFPIYDDENSPVISAIKKNIKSCEVSWEEQFKNFTSTPCEGNYNYSKGLSLAAPSAWSARTGNTRCISIHTGSANGTNLEYHEGGKYQSMDRPYIIEFNTNGNKITERFFAFSSGHLGSSSHQAPANISLGGNENRNLIRIKGDSGYLWSGSASMEVDAIYELKKDGTTELIDEILYVYH